MQTLEELEADIIRRVFDESFLDEKLLTKLLHAYRDAERERVTHVLETVATRYSATHAVDEPQRDFLTGAETAMRQAIAAIRA